MEYLALRGILRITGPEMTKTTSGNAVMTLNGHAFHFLRVVLQGNAFDKLKQLHNGAFHPWHWSPELFPGLKELTDQDPRPEGAGFEDADAPLTISLGDRALADIHHVLAHEAVRMSNQLAAPDDDLKIASFIDMRAGILSDLEEVLYLAHSLQADLPKELRDRAREIAEERNDPDNRTRMRKPDPFDGLDIG